MGKGRLNIFFLLIFLAVGTSIIGAADSGSLEWYGGINYNTYDLKELNNFLSAEGYSKIRSGPGFVGGVREWMTDRVAIGGEYNHLTGDAEQRVSKSNSKKETLEYTGKGILVTMSYKLTDNLLFNVAGGQYSCEVDYFQGKERGLGFKVGLEGQKVLSDRVVLAGRVAYRSSNIDLDKSPILEVSNLDFSGFEGGVYLNLVY